MDSNLNLQEEKDAIFKQLVQFISEIIGADVVEELEITKESVFTKDLEMDSIEIVAFAEKVKIHYGKDIDFTKWISSLDLDELIALSLNSIVDFVAEALYNNKQ
jgi:acyl carrier protein